MKPIEEVGELHTDHPADREDAVRELIVRFHMPIYRYCFHMLQHKQETEDAVQDIFLKVVQQSARLRSIQSPSAWIYQMAHNHCLNLAAKKRLQRLLPLRLIGASPVVAEDSHRQTEEDMAIEAMLSCLNPGERSIMILRVIEDKSHEDIAAIIGVTPAAARKKFERAKGKLRQICMKEEGKAHDPDTVSFI